MKGCLVLENLPMMGGQTCHMVGQLFGWLGTVTALHLNGEETTLDGSPGSANAWIFITAAKLCTT